MARRGNSSSDRRRRPSSKSRPSAKSRSSERTQRLSSTRSRLRAGLRSKRVTGAARVLGLTTTRRAAVAALVVCALAFTLAVPLRTYLSQQAEVSQLEQRKEQLEGKVAELERKKAELDDPAQVEAEARRRLRYVMPGETPYVVQLPESDTSEQDGSDGGDPSRKQPWYERLWSSVEQGG